MALNQDTAVHLMVAPSDETARPRTPRVYDTVEKVLAATIHRHSGAQLRIYALRLVARDASAGEQRPAEYVNISVARWFKVRDGGWRSDAKPWRGGPLIFPSEIPLVAAALQRALEITRELGWTR